MEPTNEERQVSKTFLELINGFKPAFGNEKHIELRSVLENLSHDEEILKLKVEASKGQANYRKRILDGKRTAIFILKKLSEDALRKT